LRREKLNDISAQIKNFIIDNFMFGDGGGLEEGTSFLDSGIIDSTGILELVTFLEETFKIKVEDEELVPENLGSVSAIAGYLKIKRNGNRQRESLQ
jgi:acyl carrier protein